ncbi:cell division protein ZapE [Stutzerimonas urumqiensis]|uniref:cell division protein ZapE n=1 Tax=Stutzerimonas urumqiensis TaxID=638269 RepID=UPI003DA4E34D
MTSSVDPAGPAEGQPSTATLIGQRFEQALADRAFVPDPAQKAAMRALADWLDARLRPRRWRRQPAAGVYLWGGVGRGKSFVMDRFFEAAPVADKRRVHFHAFLQEVQVRSAEFAGRPDPLRLLAEAIAQRTRLLCFDEFHVHDIGDARLLGRLLEGLVEAGVGLVCTSNYAPRGLCPNPLYRERFAPTIAVIERRFQVLELDGGEDYRQRGDYRWGDYRQAEASDWLAGAPGPGPQAVHDVACEVHHRPLHLLGRDGDTAWLTVDELFREPRSSRDYLWLCDQFRRLVVGPLAPLHGERTDVIQRFVNFIDNVYDADLHLTLVGTAPREALLDPAAHPDLARTASRLAQLESRP